MNRKNINEFSSIFVKLKPYAETGKIHPRKQKQQMS